MARSDHLAVVIDERAPSIVSYIGAGFSVGSGLTLTEWGVVVGILTALLTFIANMIYQARRERREQQRHELLIQQMKQRVRGDACEGIDS